ncbi:hypothetical protein LCGC14_0883730 [marine sediment metagenome]|uniref:PD-(D/E)XK endonuclease-like domain-containing protein n=1 Tax=marine sediment metagenome TaxID=412755 RepID=A0A0F9P148_9ZZZZ
MMDVRLTNSEMQAMKDCSRKAQLAYQLGIRPRTEPRPLRVGSAFHLGLDLFAQSRSGAIDLSLEACEAHVISKYDEHEPGGDPDSREHYEWEIEREILARMLAAYRWRWREADSSIRYIATEEAFDIPLVNPETGRSSRTFTLAGKIDKIISFEGNTEIVEHKTTTREIDPSTDVGQKYWQRLRIDSQISTYYIAAMALGYNPKDVLYDVVCIPTIEPCWLSQRDTKALKETGEYFYTFRGDDKPTSINMNQSGWGDMSGPRLDQWREEREYVLESKEVAGELIATVDGVRVDAKKGAKFDSTGAFAIKESVPMYGQRITADTFRRPDHYFIRRAIPRLEQDLQEHMYGVWELAQQFRRNRELGLWPKNDRHCIGFGTCPYFDLCTGGFDPRSFAEGKADLPDGFVVVDNIHQELPDSQED